MQSGDYFVIAYPECRGLAKYETLLSCRVLEKVDSEKEKGVHNGIREEKTANLSLNPII
jgi:hypothetical protein